MYVALRNLKEQLPDGKVVDLYPGDAVTTFESWPYNNQVSAISYRLVAKAPEGEKTDAEALLAAGPNVQVRAELAEKHGWGRKLYNPVQPPPRAPAPALEPALAQAPAREAEDVELEKALGIEAHACELCEYVANSPAGLKIHRSRVHKPSGA